ncbi:MAG TPA: OsmC family protein, partial [Cellulomonas sp.]|uniref:OsmC family protein n=1 Tax=Cellulomonas sp. TaxID=40001 RepID=UPI002E2FBF65
QIVGEFEVVVGAGRLRSGATGVVRFPHRWTPEGVTVESAFTGAHLLHLAAAGCVLNDVYREAERLGVVIDGVRVRASGGFNPETWQSTGIEYAVEVDSPAPAEQVDVVLAAVDSVAEIPRSIRAGATVERIRD